MDGTEQAYIKLRRHLDSQPVGFPATESGAEIRILKHIFTPWEAEIAACLSHRPEPAEKVFERAAHLVGSIQELTEALDRIQKKGGIETRIEGGRKYYCNAPLVVGMYEMQLNRLTPEFIRDFNEYTRDRKFGIEFLSTDLPQMRTIPVSRSILPRHHVSTYDELGELVRCAQGPFAVIECICRKKKEMEGKPCKVTERKETCLALGGMAQMVLLSANGREIDREELEAILDENQQEGLVLQPSNTQRIDFVCSCCGCCCGMLDVHRHLPRPLEFWAANFQAVVAPESCTGCGVCVKRCQVGAVRVPKGELPAEIDPHRCIGCGLCVHTCPGKAVSLRKKPGQLEPPPTRDDLYEIILARKKGPLKKLKLTGKLLFDAIRLGRTDLLHLDDDNGS